VDTLGMSGTPPPVAARSAADDRPPGTFTREELDAAEPERPPSFRRRWLIGFVLGSVGGAVAGWAGPISLVALVTLPWAFTPAGAGLLFGSGSLWLAYLVIVADQAGGGPTGVGTAILAAVPVAMFGIGLVGTLAAYRRVRVA
jgi:hypothetical protein